MNRISIIANIFLIPWIIGVGWLWQYEKQEKERYRAGYHLAYAYTTLWMHRYEETWIECRGMIEVSSAYHMYMDNIQAEKDSLRWLAFRIKEGGANRLLYMADTIRFYPKTRDDQSPYP